MKTYLYAHILPETGEIIYIGIGTEARAWTTHKRSAPHKKIIDNLLTKGYSPADYVCVIAQGLSDKDARLLEMSTIRTLLPILNQQGNGAANAGRGTVNKNSVLTDVRVRDIRAEFAKGDLSIRAIARDQGVAYTTARKVIQGVAWTHVI